MLHMQEPRLILYLTLDWMLRNDREGSAEHSQRSCLLKMDIKELQMIFMIVKGFIIFWICLVYFFLFPSWIYKGCFLHKEKNRPLIYSYFSNPSLQCSIWICCPMIFLCFFPSDGLNGCCLVIHSYLLFYPSSNAKSASLWDCIWRELFCSFSPLTQGSDFLKLVHEVFPFEEEYFLDFSCKPFYWGGDSIL